MTASSQEPQAPERDQVEPGTLAQDTELGRVGVVVGHEGTNYQLRPVRGGVVWDVSPEHLRPVAASDLLREKVRQANRRSIGGLL
ncbi:hypothetical protein [Streptomyces sp. SBT349]|uniref:hypothetical protein n=1 Tax=Streptomyces sp. SBT349 TaxID=1580539 RepID=UPI00066D6755|nr:hypothetical protein [Streptomyces sp. SBT349]